MEYIIGSVIILIALLAGAFIWRKKFYKEVDKLETKKIDIQHRPILEELTKVKRLNMNGQTEERFERWRATWTEVVDVQLAEVDSLLFEAEEAIDKFRVNKFSTIKEEILNRLEQAEVQMNTILEELEELMGSDEKNREEMSGIQETYKEARHVLFSQRHTFGKAAEALELKVEAISPKLTQYEELTANGNYLEARELVLKLADEVAAVAAYVQEIPTLYNDANYSLGVQVSEVKEGYNEMTASGYPIPHLSIEKVVQQLTDDIEKARIHINRIELEEAKELVSGIEEELERTYDALEEEVEARQHVQEHRTVILQQITKLIDENQSLQRETEAVQQSYQLTESEVEVPQELARQFAALLKRYDITQAQLDQKDVAYSVSWTELSAIQETLQTLEPEQEQFSEQLNTLRRDETMIREKGSALRKQLKEQERLLKSANLPLIPSFIKHQLNDSYEQLEQLERSLLDKPIDIQTTHQHADTAEAMVGKASDDIDSMIHTAYSVENVIQYGNRYRSKHEAVYNGLKEAESLFRLGDYQRALETAAEAIEKVDPSVLQKVQELEDEKKKDKQPV